MLGTRGTKPTNDLLYLWRDGNHQGFLAFGFFQQDSHTAGARGGKANQTTKRTLFHGFGKTDTAATMIADFAVAFGVGCSALLCASHMPDYPFLEIAKTAFPFVLLLLLLSFVLDFRVFALLLIKRTILIYCYFFRCVSCSCICIDNLDALCFFSLTDEAL